MNLVSSKPFVAPFYSKKDFSLRQPSPKFDLESKSATKTENRLLHKYIQEDPNKKSKSLTNLLSNAKTPLVVTGGLAVVSFLMGHEILGLIVFAAGSLFVINKINS